VGVLVQASQAEYPDLVIRGVPVSKEILPNGDSIEEEIVNALTAAKTVYVRTHADGHQRIAW
jgi:hypothetical protein